MSSPATVYEGSNNVYSDITKYALIDHIKDFLISKYPDSLSKGKMVRHFSIVVSNLANDLYAASCSY